MNSGMMRTSSPDVLRPSKLSRSRSGVYFLAVKLSRAYSNLAVLGDHRAHGTDGAVDGALIRHAIDLLESVRTQGENDPYWNARMGYSCLMAYPSAATAYEYAKRWLTLAPEDPNAQKLVRDCEE